jgi:DNA helicase-2/ATP-dependent DNA helicase PcrA
MSDKIYEGLNAEQRQAVDFDKGPCLLVAGPGSGKTTVITRRVANLIRKGVNPSRILILTFTRSAAQSMIDRAKRLEPAAAEVNGGTFHSIAHRLIKENSSIFKLPESPSILDPADVNQIFKRLFAEKANKSENMPPYKTIAKAVSYAANTQMPLEDVIYERHTQYVYALNFIKEMADEYKAYKRERKLLDYDDLLILWVKMLQHPLVGKSIRDRFDYILVDEHQDSNALQCAIIDGLGPNVMAVGDPAQSIYAFRGSAPRTMFAFMETHENATMIKLNQNYRSSSEIIDVANAIDAMMLERFDRTLVSASGFSGILPEFVAIWNGFDEASLIVDRILAHKDNGIPLHEQAVLVRTMNAARLVEGALTEKRIPYKVTGGIKLSEAKHLKDFLSVVRCAVNILDEPAWLRALTLAKGVGEKKAIAIFNAIRSGGLFAIDPTEQALKMTKNSDHVRMIMTARQTLCREGNPVVLLESALSSLEPLLEEEYGPREWKWRKQDVEAIISMAEKFEDLAAYIAMLTIDLSVDKMSEAGTPADDSERPLTVSTVHSAKGLEWECVYIPSFIEGHMPSMMAKDAAEIEEEKRILFVAMTRPKRHLFVTRPRTGFQGVLAQESQFQAAIIENFKADKQSSAPMMKQSFEFGFDINQDVHIDPFDF